MQRNSSIGNHSISSNLLQNGSTHWQAIEDPLDDSSPHSQVLEMEADLHVEFYGYDYVLWKIFIHWILCILSLGLYYLFTRWFPRLYLHATTVPSSLRSAKIILALDSWGSVEILDVTHDIYHLAHIQTFSFRCQIFILLPFASTFIPSYEVKNSFSRSISEAINGLKQAQVDEKKAIYGLNLVDIPSKGTSKMLLDEVLHPFFMFQAFSIILWGFEGYVYYAGCIFFISVVSAIIALVENKKNYHRLKEMSQFESTVLVFRNGQWERLSSTELVPGDLFEIDSYTKIVPCDSILLSGDCLINESMLTGESVPVFKSPASDQVLGTDCPKPEIINRHFLFYGTRVVRARQPAISLHHDLPPITLAIAIRTGFNTVKGGLIRSMIHPKPNNFQFYRDSFRFIGVLACIAGMGFIFSVIWFIKNGRDPSFIIIRALDLITIVVPPALPAAMSIGTSFALNRLKKKKIFCISPPRLNICGKLNLIVFDKTGTLTEDGLDVHGVQCCRNPSSSMSDLCQLFADITNDDDFQSNSPLVSECLATCHSLRSFENELFGDPMDIKMFDFSKYNFIELDSSSSHMIATVSPRIESVDPSIVLHEYLEDSLITPLDHGLQNIGIIQCFEFSSKLKRMSVTIKRLRDETYFAYSKGAPEVIKEICAANSIPYDFDHKLDEHVRKGYRVLALAGKRIDANDLEEIHGLTREFIEINMIFLGYLIFENRVKKETEGVLKVLKKAKIRDVMCTGDNLLTAVSVGRECGLVNFENHVFTAKPEITKSLVWESIDHPFTFLDSKTLLPLQPLLPRSVSNTSASSIPTSLPDVDIQMQFIPVPVTSTDLEIGISKKNKEHYSLALTGDMYDYVLENEPPEVINKILLKTSVYARMSPDQKQSLIERLRILGYCVGMCGDGANDCGALTAADVGISLSETEASVAAPFTSQINNIDCVLQIIREGRAALVTSFSCFKFMALYSMIQFCSAVLMYVECAALGDFQYLSVDLIYILPLAIFMGRTESRLQIHEKGPTVKLVSRKVLSSIIGQIVIVVSLQIGIFTNALLSQGKIPVCDGKAIPSPENSMMYLLSCFQYVWAAVVFSVGHPYRASLFSNRILLVIIVALVIFSLCVTIGPSAFLMHIIKLVDLSKVDKVKIVVFAVVTFSLMIFGEKVVFPAVATLAKRLMYTNSSKPSTTLCRLLFWRKLKTRKAYKIIEEDMQK